MPDDLSLTPALLEAELDPADVRTALGSVSFMPRFLVQTTLPHSDPGEVAAWTRENGRSRLTVQPFIEARGRKLRNYGIPYGAIPRLIIAFIGTEVVVKDSPEIELGDCLSGFMGELGLVSKRGRWGTNERLKEQMRRIATCKIAYTEDAPIVGTGRRGQDELGKYRDVSMVQGYDAFWKRVHPNQTALWSSTLTLTPQAFESFREHPVPVNMHTLRALSKSPLALDLYTWLSHRLFRLQGPTKTISYELLAAQFGSNYGRLRRFRTEFNEALGKVLGEYKEAKVELVEGGIQLRPSKPHVKRTKFLEGKD